MDLEWGTTDTDGMVSFEYESKHIEQDSNRLFGSAGIAELVIGEVTSNPRWVQVYTPSSEAPTSEEISDSGTTAVPEQVFGLYLSDDETQEGIRDSLSTLLQALQSRPSLNESDGEPESSGRSDDGARGGLRLTAWNAGSSRDSNSLLTTCLDNWQDELHRYVKQTSQAEPFAAEVGQRLRAINSVSLQLLVLDAALSDAAVPKQTVLNCLHDVYIGHSDGPVGGVLGDYLYNVTLGKPPSEVPESVLDALQSEIIPNLVFAQIIIKSHLYEDMEHYYKNHGWAFEQLVNKCYSPGHPPAESFTEGEVESLSTKVFEDTASVRETIENSQRLHHYGDSRYLQMNGLRNSVLELLAPSVLYAGPDAIRSLRNAGGLTNQTERILEQWCQYLPPNKRSQVDSIL